jgi:hypothetical protein
MRPVRVPYNQQAEAARLDEAIAKNLSALRLAPRTASVRSAPHPPPVPHPALSPDSHPRTRKHSLERCYPHSSQQQKGFPDLST